MATCSGSSARTARRLAAVTLTAMFAMAACSGGDGDPTASAPTGETARFCDLSGDLTLMVPVDSADRDDEVATALSELVATAPDDIADSVKGAVAVARERNMMMAEAGYDLDEVPQPAFDDLNNPEAGAYQAAIFEWRLENCGDGG